MLGIRAIFRTPTRGCRSALVALRPAETPTPGQSAAGTTSKADGSIHDVCDRPVKSGDLVAAELIVSAQCIEPVLSRPDDALTQRLIGRPAGRETGLGVEVGATALVVNSIVRNTATLPRGSIAVMSRHNRQRRCGERPACGEVAAAAVALKRRERRPLCRPPFVQPLMLGNFDAEFQVVQQGQRLRGILCPSRGQRRQQQADRIATGLTQPHRQRPVSPAATTASGRDIPSNDGKPIAGVGRRQASIPPTRDPQNCAKTSHPLPGAALLGDTFAMRAGVPRRLGGRSLAAVVCVHSNQAGRLFAHSSRPRARFRVGGPAGRDILIVSTATRQHARAKRSPAQAEHRVHLRRSVIIAIAAATKPAALLALPSRHAG